MAFPKRKNIQKKDRQKLVIVGSKNPVKIQCTDNGFHQAFEDQQFIVQGMNVDSQVSDQPFGDQETFQGAFNRAKNAKKSFPEADFWVGIEGGVDDFEDQMVAYAWVVVLDHKNQIGKSKTGTFFLPDIISKLIKNGLEPGAADDKVFDRENSKEGNGAVGILTHGHVNRVEYYQQAILLALIPFMNGHIY
ncbi:inosine/xanthosine triphosphatase [Echinicola jeungdonensis]|uniref:Probable inosine/xanthosine triphosphatase n=1 Tax=Echinicola jeungdonensis TaxID=709343 RepID=A0ABV5J6N8_9BACT|nr:inosine/xanthosine triphosphatase [Echinicola jeungdonensis]MDN3669257.1 inosine/xanthosine triphosphatase [Echinicola jeungdonensis]